MTKPFRADYHDPAGYLDIEYDRRIGYFSMTVDHLHDHYELYYLLSGERIYFIKDRSYRVRARISYSLTGMPFTRRWTAAGRIMIGLSSISGRSCSRSWPFRLNWPQD